MDTVRSDSGVTLLELMIVVAIVGILALIAAPNIAAFTNKYRLTRVANDYAMSVNLARSQAIAFNRPMRVVHVNTDSAPGDGSRTNKCTWDIKARCVDPTDGSISWNTIPCDYTNDGDLDGDGTGDGEFEASPNSGYYDYDNDPTEATAYVPNISMEATAGHVVNGSCFEFTTRGSITSSPDSADCASSAQSGQCWMTVAFRNKAASNAGRIQVCVGNPSGITTLHSNENW